MSQLDSIIGLPPDIGGDIYELASVGAEFNGVNYLKGAAFPILHLIPQQIETAGIQGYTLQNYIDEYSKDLSRYNITMPDSNIIKVACMADNLPSESFSNTFGESNIFGGLNSASEGLREFMFMMGGTKSALGKADNIGTMADEKLGNEAYTTMKEAGIAAFNKLPGNIQNAASMAGNLAMGQRANFPLVWKSANFQPTMSFTVKLYNPAPGDNAITKQYIVDPLIALLLFVIPRSDNGMTYEWPFLCKFSMPGILQEYAGYVSNISVIKGGNERSIGFNQRMGLMELKLDMGILYPTMINSAQPPSINSHTPTLKDYYMSLLLEKPIMDEKKEYIRKIVQPGTPKDKSNKTPLGRIADEIKDKVNEIKKKIPKPADIFNIGK